MAGPPYDDLPEIGHGSVVRLERLDTTQDAPSTRFMHTHGICHVAAGRRLLLALVAGCFALFAGPLPLAAAALPKGEPEPERVLIKTEDGLSLVGTYFAPHDTKHKAPGALLVHDAGGSRADMEALALRLQKTGFAALTIDLRGHGESATAELDWKKLDADGQTRNWAFMTRDVKAGVDLLLSQKTVHSTTVSLIGYGAGCTLVARHATRDDKVRDLVLLNPQAEQLGFTLAKDMVELAGLPTCIGVGKEDAATAKRMGDIANHGEGEDPTEIMISKGDAAGLLEDAKLGSDVVRWMKTKALPGAAVRPPDAKPVR